MKHQLSPRADRFRDLLENWPPQRVRVPLDDLWRMLDEADPTSRMSLARRQQLADTIDELARAELIRLPAERSYDRNEKPPVPNFVTLLRPEPDTGPRHDTTRSGIPGSPGCRRLASPHHSSPSSRK